jgi:hypothetical protein
LHGSLGPSHELLLANDDRLSESLLHELPVLHDERRGVLLLNELDLLKRRVLHLLKNDRLLDVLNLLHELNALDLMAVMAVADVQAQEVGRTGGRCDQKTQGESGEQERTKTKHGATSFKRGER